MTEVLTSLSLTGFVLACLAAAVSGLTASVYGAKAMHRIREPAGAAARVKMWMPAAVVLCPEILTEAGLQYRRKYLLSFLIFALSACVGVLLANFLGNLQ